MSSDNNMTTAAVATLISLFDGVTTDTGVAGERVIGNFPVSDYYNFIDGGELAVHDVFDDSHFTSDTSGLQGAWLVSRSHGKVPEPGTIAIWSVLGLVGLGVRRRKVA